MDFFISSNSFYNEAIPFIKEKIKKTSKDYKKDKMKAEKLYGIFNVLIKQIEKNIEN